MKADMHGSAGLDWTGLDWTGVGWMCRCRVDSHSGWDCLGSSSNSLSLSSLLVIILQRVVSLLSNTGFYFYHRLALIGF